MGEPAKIEYSGGEPNLLDPAWARSPERGGGRGGGGGAGGPGVMPAAIESSGGEPAGGVNLMGVGLLEPAAGSFCELAERVRQ